MALINNFHLSTLFILSCLLTIFFIYTLRSVARKIGLVDQASHRKLHKGDVPLIGGIGIFLGFVFSLLLTPISLGDHRILFAVCILMIIIGCLDDLHELSSNTKFVLEICLACICIFWGKIELQSLGDIFFIGSIQLGMFSAFFTIFCMLGIINAINMLDGSDGIVGSSTLIQLTFLAYIAFEAKLWCDYYLIVLLIAAIVGFLCFNLPFKYIKKNNYLVFLGDSGSLFIGFFLVWFIIKLSQNELTFVSPIVMLWIMALPLYDTIAVIIQRKLKGYSAFKPQRDHFHHSFNIDYPEKIVGYAIIINILFGATGIILKKLALHDGYSFLLFCFISLLYLKWKLQMHK